MNITPEEDLQPQDDSADNPALGFIVGLVAALLAVVALASGFVAL